MPRLALRGATVLAVATLFGPLPPARALDAPPPAEGAPAAMGEVAAPPPVLETVPAAVAAVLVDGLKGVQRAKSLEEAAPAFDALAGKTHPDLEPALGRLLAHAVAPIAVRAAALLGERATPKSGATLWKAWLLPVNQRRYAVKGAMLRAWARTGAPLDKRQYDEAEELWRLSQDGDAMEGFCEHFTVLRKDKRPCRLLAEWLDEPSPANVHDGSNPPEDWWRKRWALWRRTRARAIEALAAITGQTFDATAQAKAWFEANPGFGVRW